MVVRSVEGMWRVSLILFALSWSPGARTRPQVTWRGIVPRG
jgi:hypothetical protein